MAAAKELKAVKRENAGKGAARAERRAGRVPGTVYGENQPAASISVDSVELGRSIFAGRFLTTVFDLDIDGQKTRVIPRDFQLDPLKDQPIHVDFQRLGKGAVIKVAVPVHFVNQADSPGIKRGGTLNVVRHTVEFMAPAESIPESITADLAGLEINDSLHISAVKLPEGVVPLIRDRDFTIATIVPSSGYLEEMAAAAQKAKADAAAAEAAAAAGTPAAGDAAAPAAGAAAPAAAAKPEGGDKK
ncbi:MAG: 50S ribosomal protein L25/general stress protein Ctc [Xanthobacteraceae bacterium]|nr:50S ribosomal protein L25/general stress protein Ctc [Xanthobacteraceae bacterium]MCW5676728.1 50S ribosomal protein L25/general stress protein Ctc [Xanthobacteraceae bacterium]